MISIYFIHNFKHTCMCMCMCMCMTLNRKQTYNSSFSITPLSSRHAKVRARKANHSSPKWKDPSILSTVSVETKPRHAKTYHDQTFRPNAAMDTSGVYIFGVSGTLSGTLRGESASRQGTVSSTTSSKYRESNT